MIKLALNTQQQQICEKIPDGTYENYNVQVFDEIVFTRNELKDYMLVYR